MKHYYEHGGITIYNCDCLDILPEINKCGLLLTDPPYGIGSWSATGGNSLSQAEVDEINGWDLAAGIDTLQLCIAKADYSIVWGGNYFGIGKTRAPLIWDKANRGMHYADGEMAWTNFDFGTLRIFNYSLAESEVKNKRRHPTQKPINLMKWCINQAKRATGVILDPFMGSGTTLEAAKEMGRKAVGIEIQEKYCEIAAKRLDSCAVLPFGDENEKEELSLKIFEDFI